MQPSQPQIFSKVSPDQYATLIRNANASGFSLAGNSGAASNFGMEVSWNYSPESRELAIQCLSATLFLKPEAVNAKIKTLVEEVVRSPDQG